MVAERRGVTSVLIRKVISVASQPKVPSCTRRSHVAALTWGHNRVATSSAHYDLPASFTHYVELVGTTIVFPKTFRTCQSIESVDVTSISL